MRMIVVGSGGRTLGIALLCAVPLLVLGASRATADQVFRWTDEKGNVHFSNVAPAGQEEKTEESVPAEPEPAAIEPESRSGTVGGATEGAPAEKTEPVKEKPGRFANLGDDSFSAQVSRQLTALKREIAEAKRHVIELDDQIAAVREERGQAIDNALQTLQGVTNPSDVESEKEQALKKEKEETEKRIEAIRKEYGDLREEAVKRYGSLPGWWLPIE